MSVYGSMTTAVSGLAAQARALGNLSDNIANSQTIGYKRVETSFATLVTQSNADVHSPGGVRAMPTYTNSLQGNISQTESTTNLALSGAGFFQVSRGTEETSGVDFQNTPYFTRAGDFSLDRFGYLKNNAGMYLNGWGLSETGDINRGTITPIRAGQDQYGRECKEFQHKVIIDGRQETANGTACRGSDGQWQLVAKQ